MGLVLALQHSYSNQSSNPDLDFKIFRGWGLSWDSSALVGICWLTSLTSWACSQYIVEAQCHWSISSILCLVWSCLRWGVVEEVFSTHKVIFSLCKASWPFCSAYKNGVLQSEPSFRRLYLKLDEARLTFNADAFEVSSTYTSIFQGMGYIFRHRLVDDNIDDLVNFFHYASGLDPFQKRRYLETRYDLLSG